MLKGQDVVKCGLLFWYACYANRAHYLRALGLKEYNITFKTSNSSKILVKLVIFKLVFTSF